jgi:hypothetical protein
MRMRVELEFVNGTIAACAIATAVAFVSIFVFTRKYVVRRHETPVRVIIVFFCCRYGA